MRQSNQTKRSTTSYPLYKNGEILYARFFFFFFFFFFILTNKPKIFCEDGLWYKAKVTDLLPETQSYLVVFVEYGNSQACTAADLAPLDMPVTHAAPPVLEETDPAIIEAQRKARITERQQQLKAEEDARQKILEEKRKVVAERKARAEALEKAETLAKIEEQRAKLEALQQRQVDNLSHQPAVPGARKVDSGSAPLVAASAVFVSTPSRPVQTPAANTSKVVESPAVVGASTPLARTVVVTASAPPSAQKTPVNQKTTDKRMTLSVAGGSGAKLGLMNGITLKELKQVAVSAPAAVSEGTPKKHPLDMTVTEARVNKT
jgi:hypothetical protein